MSTIGCTVYNSACSLCGLELGLRQPKPHMTPAPRMQLFASSFLCPRSLVLASDSSQHRQNALLWNRFESLQLMLVGKSFIRNREDNLGALELSVGLASIGQAQ